MKKPYSLAIELPSGASAKVEKEHITLSKGSVTLTRSITLAETELKVAGHELIFHCAKANKKHIAAIRAQAAHIRNMFNGLENEYKYTLEICNVHFPMTVKVDKHQFIINNFLGEKRSRVAPIPQGVKVEVNGQKVTVSSHDLEQAGQTAAAIERVTHVNKRDRRVFQDGIFIIEKPGEADD